MLLLTKHRRRILDLIKKSEEHMTAEMIQTRVAKDPEPIGIATIYRSLNLLYDAGYVNRVHHQKLGYVYELKKDEHYHFHCTNCDRIVDIDMPYADGFNEEVKKHINCEVCSHTLMFEGVCEHCKQKKNS